MNTTTNNNYYTTTNINNNDNNTDTTTTTTINNNKHDNKHNAQLTIMIIIMIILYTRNQHLRSHRGFPAAVSNGFPMAFSDGISLLRLLACNILPRSRWRRAAPAPRCRPGSRTNGVNTKGAAAKIRNFDRLGKSVRPGTFGKFKIG